MVVTTLKQKIFLFLLGVFLTLLLIEGGMRLAGFTLTSLHEHCNRKALARKNFYRILCLGESTTYFGGKYSYPQQLENILNARSHGLRFAVINKGIPGASTNTILDQLNKNLDQYQPDLVITMMGINDDYRFGLHGENREQSFLFSVWSSLKIYRLAESLRKHLIDLAKVAAHHFTGPQNRNKNSLHLQSPVGLESQKSLKRLIQHPSYHPNNEKSLLQMGISYLLNKNLAQARRCFQKILHKNPAHPDAALKLGQVYFEEQRFDQAKRCYRRVLLNHPDHPEAWLGLADIYSQTGRDRLAEKIYRKVVTDHPEHNLAWRNFGRHLVHLNKFKHAESVFYQGLKENPQFLIGYDELGRLYFIQGRFNQSAEMYKKFLATYPDYVIDHHALMRLIDAFRKNNDFKSVEATLIKILDKDPFDDRATRMLWQLYREMGIGLKAAEYLKKTEKISTSFYHSVTADNYNQLTQVLKNRGIPLICVQYPIRRLEPLKQLFDNHDGIIFVDNEKSFKKALETKKYYDLFINNFAGDFGHATREGNRLLAENVAKAVLDYIKQNASSEPVPSSAQP